MNISKQFLVICLILITLFLNACSGMTRSDKPAVTTWWLKPYAGAVRVEGSDALMSVDLTVIVVPGLDSDQILTLSDDAKLKPYAGARWADNLPELVSSMVGRTLEASGRFQLKPGRSDANVENCNLGLEISEFFAHLSPSGQTSDVRIAIDGNFQCGFAVPVQVRLNALIPVEDGRMTVIVAAFQTAMDRVMRDLLAQLYKGG